MAPARLASSGRPGGLTSPRRPPQPDPLARPAPAHGQRFGDGADRRLARLPARQASPAVTPRPGAMLQQQEAPHLSSRQQRPAAQRPPPPCSELASTALRLEELALSGRVVEAAVRETQQQRQQQREQPRKRPQDEQQQQRGEPPAGGDALLSPQLALLVAAALWGSYSVSVRLLYASDAPPDASIVMAVRGMLQAAAMLAVSTALVPHQQAAAAAAADAAARAEQQRRGGAAWLLEQFLTQRAPPLWMAAAELGLWNFTATALQTLGLQLTSATRASFLIQATVMLTPLLSMLAGYRPGPRVWAACGLALAGTLLVTADEAAGGPGGVAAGLGGDGAILAAALFYSIGVVRISGYAQSLPPSQIATSKSFVLGGLAVASLAFATGSAAAQGQPPEALWGGLAHEPAMWVALLWSGLGPGALASYLHAKGQKHVEPSEAQIIFSSKPVWAAGLAWLLLGGEQLGPLTWAGGATLVAAGLLAAQEVKAPRPAAEQR